MSVINELNLRDEVYTEEIPQELPEQGGSFIPNLAPGSYWFRLPAELPQLWATFDQTKDVITGQPLATPIQRLQIKCDRDHPLVVVGPPEDGAILTATISNMPRKRSKKSDVPPVSDMTYLLRDGLLDNSPVNSPKTWMAVMNTHAGGLFPAEVGIQGQCRADKIRYVPDNAGGQMEDPGSVDAQGNAVPPRMGCDTRYYTQAFKLPNDPATGKPVYAERIMCKCGAIIRGFAQIDRFLKNPGSAAPAAG